MSTSIGNYPSSTYATTAHSTSTASAAVESRSLASQVLEGIYQVGMTSASGALAGYVFGFINPAGGAIFAVSSSLAHVIATGLAERFTDSTLIKTAVWATSFIASIAIGVTVATAAGFPLTTLGAIGMTAAMLVTNLGLNCCTTMATVGTGCCLLVAKEKLCPTPQPSTLAATAIRS